MPQIPKVATTSENIQNENLTKLRSVFPNFVKDGQIDFDQLQAFLKSEGLLSGEEKYGLSWAGKSNAFRAIRTPATGTLTPQPEESKNWDTTQNIFIEGDNLEVLKLLQKHYRGEIKMIYIDPPYNTGKDFVYKDNFTKWVADYYEQTGQTKDGIRMTANTEKNGRYHSDWLTMMYPRLFLAHNLLWEDGVIFVSIDDNEVANLRMIMDEIFGEENFVAQIVWQKKKWGWNDANFMAIEHEYILLYGRNLSELGELISMYSEKYLMRYREEDEKTKFFWDTFKRKSGKQYYPIKCPDWTIVEYDSLWNKISWLRSEATFLKNIEDGEIKFEKTKDSWSIFFKQRLPKWKTPRSILQNNWTTSSGSAELLEIFEKNIFENPKPVDLLWHLLEIGSDDNCTILDFFSGSGTTAHAMMKLNAEDEGNRRFICVQLPEATEEESEAYKARYKKISDISRERIRRAGDKIWKGDIGFKSFVLESSNYRQWNTLTDSDDAESLKAQMKLFAEKPLTDGVDEIWVVYELLVKEGFGLNALVKEVTVGDLKVWKVLDEGRGLVVTFVPHVTQEQVELLKLTDADTFVCFDSALDDTTKVNLAKNFNIKVI
jgi:adenine-specific DNA-methyltransferase